MTQPEQSRAALDHARHDAALIAAFADRANDLSDADRVAVQDRIAACEGCRDLFADLVVIRDQLVASGTPARPRDFTLSVEDARRLRSTGWRRAVGFFGSARDAFSRPLAISFTTIGIVALVVTASPLSFGVLGGQSASAPALETIGNGVGAAGGASAAPSAGGGEPSREIAGVVASPAASAAASAASEAAPSASMAATAAPAPASFAASHAAASAATGPSSKDGDYGQVFTGSNDTDNVYGDDDGDATDATTGVAGRSLMSGGPSLGILIGGICLVLGVGLFALRWTSRRLGNA